MILWYYRYVVVAFIISAAIYFSKKKIKQCIISLFFAGLIAFLIIMHPEFITFPF